MFENYYGQQYDFDSYHGYNHPYNNDYNLFNKNFQTYGTFGSSIDYNIYGSDNMNFHRNLQDLQEKRKRYGNVY